MGIELPPDQEEDTRVCGHCLKRKPESQFDGPVEMNCIACSKTAPRPEPTEAHAKPPTPIIDHQAGTRSQRRGDAQGRVIAQMCVICHFFKPLSQFAKDPADRLNDGIARRCNYCMPFHLMGKAGVYKQFTDKQRQQQDQKSRSARRNRPKNRKKRRLSGKSPDIDISAKSGIGK